LLLIFTTYVELDTGEEGEIRAECHLIVNTQSSFVRRKGGSLPSVAVRLSERKILFLIVLDLIVLETPLCRERKRSTESSEGTGGSRAMNLNHREKAEDWMSGYSSER
jgi:hypothetical protein